MQPRGYGTCTERCKFVRAVCEAPAWRGRLWLAAAGQKLSLDLARTNLHLSVDQNTLCSLARRRQRFYGINKSNVISLSQNATQGSSS